MTTATVASLPEPIHVFPRTDGWVVIRGAATEVTRHYANLGLALDAATSGCHPVHVVVHEAEHDHRPASGSFEESN